MAWFNRLSLCARLVVLGMALTGVPLPFVSFSSAFQERRMARLTGEE